MGAAITLSAYDTPGGLVVTNPTPAQLRARASENPTRHYQPSNYGSAMWGAGSASLDGKPIFTWFDIPRMMRDNQTVFIASLWRAPFQKVQFGAKAGGTPKGKRDAECAAFVKDTLARFWRESLPGILARYFEFGFAAGGAEFRPRDGKLQLREVKALECTDVQPRVWKDGCNKGEFAGFMLRNSGASSREWVGSPHAFWFAGQKRETPYHDRPPLAGMFVPWLAKNTRGGAVDCEETWFRKNAARGMEVRYPPGTSDCGTDESPQIRNNQDLAREIADYHETNGVLLLENTVNPATNEYEWEVDYAEGHGDIAGFIERVDKLDERMVKGAGIPLEVIQGSDSGSGYKGRLVSYGGFLGTVDELTGLIIKACESWLLPLVQLNFGKDAWYEILPVSLAQIASEEEKRQPTNPVGQPLPGLPGDGSKAGGGGNDQPPPPDAGGGKPGLPFELSTVVTETRASNAEVLDAIKGLAAAMLAVVATKPQLPPARELSVTLGPDDTDPDVKRGALDQTQQKLMRSRKSTIAQLLALAMVRKQQEATAAGDPKAAAGSLRELSKLAGDPMQVARIIGAKVQTPGTEMSAFDWGVLELSANPDDWTPGNPSRSGTPTWVNKTTGERRYQQNRPGEKKAKQVASEAAGWEILKKVATRKATLEEVAELETHLPVMRGKELMVARRHLELNLKGERKKKWMVERILDHVEERTRTGAGPKPRGPEQGRNRRSKLAGTVAESASLFGGIDPNSQAFLRHYGSVKEAVDDGIPLAAFRDKEGQKGRNGLDALADELQHAGHIQVPEGDDPTEHVLEQMKKGAKALGNEGDDGDAALKEYEAMQRPPAESPLPTEEERARLWEEFAPKEEPEPAPEAAKVAAPAPEPAPEAKPAEPEPKAEPAPAPVAEPEKAQAPEPVVEQPTPTPEPVAPTPPVKGKTVAASSPAKAKAVDTAVKTLVEKPVKAPKAKAPPKAKAEPKPKKAEKEPAPEKQELAESRKALDALGIPHKELDDRKAVALGRAVSKAQVTGESLAAAYSDNANPERIKGLQDRAKAALAAVPEEHREAVAAAMKRAAKGDTIGADDVKRFDKALNEAGDREELTDDTAPEQPDAVAEAEREATDRDLNARIADADAKEIAARAAYTKSRSPKAEAAYNAAKAESKSLKEQQKAARSNKPTAATPVKAKGKPVFTDKEAEANIPVALLPLRKVKANAVEPAPASSADDEAARRAFAIDPLAAMGAERQRELTPEEAARERAADDLTAKQEKEYREDEKKRNAAKLSSSNERQQVATRAAKRLSYEKLKEIGAALNVDFNSGKRVPNMQQMAFMITGKPGGIEALTGKSSAPAPKKAKAEPAKASPHVAALNDLAAGLDEKDPARDLIETAVHNHGSDAPVKLARALGGYAEQTVDGPGGRSSRYHSADTVKKVTDALAKLGAKPSKTKEYGVEFQPIEGAFPGDKVEVVRPPLKIGDEVVYKGEAKLAGKTPPEPKSVKASAPAGHAVAGEYEGGAVVAKDPKTNDLTTHFAPGEPEKQAAKLGDAIKSAMEEWKLMPEFEDGVIPLGYIAHAVKRENPGATDSDVMAALKHMRDTRQVEGHGLNERQLLTDPKQAGKLGALGGGKKLETATLWDKDRAVHYFMLPKVAGKAEPKPAPEPAKPADDAHAAIRGIIADRTLSIGDVRAKFKSLELLPKDVIAEVARRQGYTEIAKLSKPQMLKKLLSNIESVKMGQFKADSITNPAPKS